MTSRGTRVGKGMATVALVAAVLAGCAGPTAGAPASQPTPTLTAAEWAEQFCVAVAASKPSGAVPLNRLSTLGRDQVLAALSKQVEGFDNSLEKLDQIGKSPVASGDEAVHRTKDAVSTARTALAAARDKISSLAPTDRAGITAAIKTSLDEARADSTASVRGWTTAS